MSDTLRDALAGMGDTADERDDDEDCWDCDGEGYVLDDCGEDTCCCAEPELSHDLLMCRTCKGKG